MKKCTWCGKEYGEELERCLVDGQPLAGRSEPSVQPRSAEPDVAVDPSPLPIRRSRRRPGSPASGKWLHLDLMEGAFFWEEGYSRPDWKLIRAAIEQKVPQENLSDAWTEAVLSWLEQLRQDLGGEYQVRAFGEFVLLS